MKDKIAFVCQRYGLEVNGGAELYCREMAEKMCAVYDVEVYTTCALDYVTWADHYPAGTQTLNGVTVHRFPVERQREIKAFNRLSRRVLETPEHTAEQEEKWVDDQGPFCPQLLDVLEREQHRYRAVVFMTYMYYLSARGLPRHFDNAYLIPTAHDEPAIYLHYYEKVFEGAKGFIWNTPEERAFVEHRFPAVAGRPGTMAGIGINVPAGPLPPVPEQLRDEPYLVYAGRIEPAKGCDSMFEFFRRYKREHGGQLRLVLMGKAVMEVPKADDIVELGFVSEEMKFAVMGGAKALVLFSRFESLSMVVLESMAMGRPVLVNGGCEVLKGHCLRSNAGLFFDNYVEFAATLRYLLDHPAEYAAMCENGKEYVAQNYQWDKIVARVAGLLSA